MLKRFLSKQARKPSGWFGRVVAKRVFDKGNANVNALMVDLVGVRNGDAVLEIGFGCGTVIREMADKIGTGIVEGIDFSDAMLDVARKRNRHHIEDGRVKLTHGDFDAAEYPASSFDTVCSANTIYFWPDPAGTCARIHAVLKPGGKVVLAFLDKCKMESMALDMNVFRPISRESVEGLLRDAGFSSAQAHVVEGKDPSYCVVGIK